LGIKEDRIHWFWHVGHKDANDCDKFTATQRRYGWIVGRMRKISELTQENT